jgi:CRP/FNR family transcriptional regulator
MEPLSSIPFTDAKLLDAIKQFARVKNIEAGTSLILPGDKIIFVPLVLKGVLRIIRQDADKEIFLYHLFAGQTCAMALNCCLGTKISPIKAVAEEDTTVLQIPVNLVDEWFKYPEWKAFINNTYGQRFTELIGVIDLIAFNNMDKQILNYLTKRCEANHTNYLNITHQQIADELHTHREAVSRLLRTMEQKKIVKLGRNSIEVL